MKYFPRCDFLRVIVATTLFGRLVDVESLDKILDEFTAVRLDGRRIITSGSKYAVWLMIPVLTVLLSVVRIFSSDNVPVAAGEGEGRRTYEVNVRKKVAQLNKRRGCPLIVPASAGVGIRF